MGSLTPTTMRPVALPVALLAGCCHGGLLGAGTGGGSCAAAPFRSTSLQWPLGCPESAPCCSEFGYCQIEANWLAGLFRDCNGVSNGRPLEPAAVAAENQAIARGDSRGANLLVVPAGSSTATVPAASRNGGYALGGVGGARWIGFGAGVAQGDRAGLGSYGAFATWVPGLGAGGAGYGAGGTGYGAGGAGSGAGGAGSGAGGAGYGAAGFGYGADGAGSYGYGLTGTHVSFPNGAVVPAVVAARANHI